MALLAVDRLDPINTVIMDQSADNLSTVDNMAKDRTIGYEMWRLVDERNSSPKAVITFTDTPESLNWP
jgi:hypothetical protein